MGIAAAGSEQAAIAWAADDGALSWWSRDSAVAGFARPTDSVPELMGTVSWMDCGFALDWAGSSGGIWQLHFLALGGAALRQAAVRRLEVGCSGPIVVGLGFEPDLLLFVPGAGRTAATRKKGLIQGIGIATGPNSQAAAAFTAWVDGTRTSVSGTQRSDAVVALPDTDGSGNLAALARLVSTGGDGFALETTLTGSEPLPLACLALGGGLYKVGFESAPRKPRRITTRRVGFQPTAVLAFTWASLPLRQ